MNLDSEPISKPYTILRIKRKRNEEPLDALVVESRVRRKKSRAGMGIFQYAQTVEHDAWEDEQRQKDIQDQISRLAQEKNRTDSKLSEILEAEEPGPSSIRQNDDSRRYTVVEHEAPNPSFMTHPPKVISAKDMPLKSSAPDFKMYDAIPHIETAPEVPSEMDKFLPMLTDYLKIHDITPSPSLNHASYEQSASQEKPPPLAATHPATTGKDILQPTPTLAENDYVWDVFYHRPATLSEWNEAANIGTLTGLPPSLGDSYDSDSDSEEEDEADEDSNAEEYYKNDYPDNSSEDEFHEGSDYDDMMQPDEGAEEDLW